MDQRDATGGTPLHAAVSRGSEPYDGIDAVSLPQITSEDLDWSTVQQMDARKGASSVEELNESPLSSVSGLVVHLR